MIQLYYGGFQTVRKSGVGQALVHQETILSRMRIPTTKKYQKEATCIHINTVLPDSVLQAILARIRGQKVIYYGHSTKEDFRNSFPGSNFIAPLFKKWIIFCYNLGDVILTPTEYSKNLLEGYKIKRPVVAVSNGVDTDYFKPNPTVRKNFRERYHLPEDQKVVISVGHMIERKGILEFIELARKMPDVTFIWFGFTPKKLITKKVETALEDRPSNIILAGFVEQEELLTAYQAADTFAFLSNEETEGIVVLEALATMIPTVLRNIPVYDGWLTHKQQVYKANNEQEIEQYVKQSLFDRKEDMLEKGRCVAKEKDFAQIGRQLCTIYDGLCNEEKVLRKA